MIDKKVTIKNIRKNDSGSINIYSTDMTRTSEKLEFEKTMEVSEKFLKTIEGINILKEKFIKIIEKVKKDKEE